MNYIYPAVFYPEDDGRYSVIFPDLNDLATYGDDLTDAFAMAGEACGQYLFTSLRDGDVLPAPSALDAVKKDDENAIVNMVCVNLDEYARAYDDKAVKKTLSGLIPHVRILVSIIQKFSRMPLLQSCKYIHKSHLYNINKGDVCQADTALFSFTPLFRFSHVPADRTRKFRR